MDFKLASVRDRENVHNSGFDNFYTPFITNFASNITIETILIHNKKWWMEKISFVKISRTQIKKVY